MRKNIKIIALIFGLVSMFCVVRYLFILWPFLLPNGNGVVLKTYQLAKSNTEIYQKLIYFRKNNIFNYKNDYAAKDLHYLVLNDCVLLGKDSLFFYFEIKENNVELFKIDNYKKTIRIETLDSLENNKELLLLFEREFIDKLRK